MSDFIKDDVYKTNKDLLINSKFSEVEDIQFDFEYDLTDLDKVKEYFKLDKMIKDIDDDWEKVLIIEEFLHNMIPHDGYFNDDCEWNSLGFVEYFKRTGKGINCAMLSITLNDMLLSVGLKSRIVGCLPYDKEDTECHVINEVWIDKFNKWVWIDPSNHLYPLNGQNIPMSIFEVRDYICNDTPFKLNEDANWNGQPKDFNRYKRYMTKNLYNFKYCSIAGFNNLKKNSLIRAKNKVIYLSPIGFEPKIYSGQKDISLVTHNKKAFL